MGAKSWAGGAGVVGFFTTVFFSLRIECGAPKCQKFASALKLTVAGYTQPLRYVSFWDDNYPASLKAIYDSPPILFYWGNAAADWMRCQNYLAIVGTRAASPLCQIATELFVKQYLNRNAASNTDNTDAPLSIVSGLAFGVDRMAHLAALKYELPNIAVLGAGIARAGPQRNLDIVQRAFKQQLGFTLISEFAPYAHANRISFPRRNRIIAGLVGQLAVMQAPQRSGALISARYALDEGREVVVFDHAAFDAKPGSNNGARSLIDSGASLIQLPELTEHLLYEAAEAAAEKQNSQLTHNSKEQLALWRAQLRGWRRLGGGYYVRL